MNKPIKLDYKNVLRFVSQNEINEMEEKALDALNKLINKNHKGSSYLGWIDLPNSYKKQDLEDIKKSAFEIRSNSEVLLVIGIGGSYLGAKAAISLLGKYFGKPDLEVIFAGNSLSSEYINELKEYLRNKDFSINVISKSGTTTEPAIAFRVFKKLLEEKYLENAKKRIYVTTDSKKGVMHQIAVKEGYKTFVIPDDVGGRYSVLTPVGLLPICSFGIDIEELLRGSSEARKYFLNEKFASNDALLYASIRNLLYKKSKVIEILVSYEPKFKYFLEWWKQLFGESEGKDKKGIYPSSLIYSTDLHSMGQFVQDGTRNIFETIVYYTNPTKDVTIDYEENNMDMLNYLAGKKISEVNKMASLATSIAHVDGGVPNLLINVLSNDSYHLGYLMYFFMISCGVSGYLLDVNPFDQEGVEEYKKNMFALLGKDGYQDLQEKLLGMINNNNE